MFHRVEDPLALPSSRYFRMAQRLYPRGGAVTYALNRQRTVEAPPAPVSQLGQPGAGGERPVVIDDVRTVAAMTQAPGFPGIEYVGG